jgi:hypothetical protein
VVLDAGQEGVPARGDQAQEGRLEGRTQKVRGDMALEVVDRGQRQPAPGGQALGGGHPHQQRADQPGPLRDRHELDVVEGGVRGPQGVVDHVVDEREVVAGRDLGHDAAVAVVDALGGDDVGAHLPRAGDDGRAGVVAAGLDGQDHSCGGE